MELLIKLLSLFSISLVCMSFTPRPYQEVVGKTFNDCKISKETVYLSKSQKRRVRELSKSDVDSALSLRYRVNCKDKQYMAYIDSHTVRTMNETLVVFIDGDQVKKIEVSSFAEPMDYFPSARWMKQFLNKKLNKKLNLYNGIDAVSGATLTSHAVANSIRRTLALHKVLGIKAEISQN